MNERELVCIAHVHSTYSDGTATVEEILAAARDAGADALLLTDHDTLAARHDGWEGEHDGMLLAVGHEVTTRDGHYLAFGLDREIDHREMSEAEICRAVARHGGVGFAAHPFSRGSRMSTRIGRPHPWSALDEESCGGIELWSLVTDAAEAWRTPAEAVRFIRNPEQEVRGPRPEQLGLWDRLGRSRRVPAIGGLDAHQSGIRIRGRVLSPFPHRRYFRMLRTHVLVRGERGVGSLLHAMANGSAFIAADVLADGRGFRFWADGERRLEMGEEAPAGEYVLNVRLPRAAHVRIVRDGRPVAEGDCTSLRWPTRSAAGVYRVEASLRGRIWILSNPIYLRAVSERTIAASA